jgi:hypothetical protein
VSSGLVVEVDIRVFGVLDPVGGAAGEQLGDHFDDLADRFDGAHEVPRRQNPQRLHVFAEQRGLAHPEHDPVVLVAARPLEQRIVDVGDVLHVVHVVSGIAPVPVHQVEGQVGGCMPEVGGVVGGDPADVHPRGVVWRGRPDLAG